MAFRVLYHLKLSGYYSTTSFNIPKKKRRVFLHSINSLVFLIEEYHVLCEIGTESLCIIQIIFSF
jgi:hypothetical protein